MSDNEVNGDDGNKNDEDDKITDRDLALSFVEKRHTEAIEGINCLTQTWRMKERVSKINYIR